MIICFTSQGSPGREKTAFTLIELLVVIAIISLLASILFPVFSRARENARKSACLSNMKQIGLGMMQYVQDYDETYPRQFGNVWFFNSIATPDPETGYYASTAGSNSTAIDNNAVTNFLNAIKPYVKATGVYVCPSSIAVPDGSNWCPSGPGSSNCWLPSKTNSTSYVGNGAVLRSAYAVAQQAPLKVASIASTADIVLVQEMAYKINGTTTRPRWDGAHYNLWHQYGTYAVVGTTEFFSNRHFDGGNLLFSDGHAKWRKYSTLTSADFGLKNCIANIWNTTSPGSDTCDAIF